MLIIREAKCSKLILLRYFEVLCTAPWKYRIIDPEGSIKPHCCVDVVIRHTAVAAPDSLNATDKFRIQMNEHNSRQLLGKKDVPVTLLPGKPSAVQQDPFSATSQEKFRHFSSSSETGSPSADISGTMQSLHHGSSDLHLPKQGISLSVICAVEALDYHHLLIAGMHPAASGPNYIAIVVAVICIIALMLPSSDVPSSSSMWSIFHLSCHQKMVFAYSLGLSTI